LRFEFERMKFLFMRFFVALASGGGGNALGGPVDKGAAAKEWSI
jgi:hypothetical protein